MPGARAAAVAAGTTRRRELPVAPASGCRSTLVLLQAKVSSLPLLAVIREAEKVTSLVTLLPREGTPEMVTVGASGERGAASGTPESSAGMPSRRLVTALAARRATLSPTAATAA